MEILKRGPPFAFLGIFNRGDPLCQFWDFKKGGPPPESATDYEVETGQPEEVTQEEQVENCHFIDLLVETDVMREAHRILVAKGKAPEEEDDFKRKLYDIWFRLYRRSRYDK